MAEIGILAVLVVSGWVLARHRTDDPYLALAAALPLGAALFVTVLLALVATRLEVAYPLLALAITAAAAGAIAVVGRHEPDLPTVPVAGAVVAVVLVVGLVVVTRGLGLVAATADSFRYVMMGGLLDGWGNLAEASMVPGLEKRGIAAGGLHGLARGEPGYLTALTPLFAASTIGIVWTSLRQAGRSVDHRVVTVVAAGAALLMVLNARFVFHAFYVNSHMLVAAWLLVLQLHVIQVRREPSGARARLDLLVTIALSAAVVTARPEGGLLVGLVLLPAILDERVSRSSRAGMLVALGLPMVAWQGFGMTLEQLSRDEALRFSSLALAALGVVVVALAAVPTVIDRVLPARRRLLYVHSALWAVLAVLAVRDPGVLYWSARATANNVLINGGWGSTLVILGGLAVAALLLLRFDGDGSLAFTLLTFVPLSLVLAYLREGAYRVGPGDSLNRMLMHMVPILVFAVAASAFGTVRDRPMFSARTRMARQEG